MADEKILHEAEITKFLGEMKKSTKKLKSSCDLYKPMTTQEYNLFSWNYHKKINDAKNIAGIDESKAFQSISFDWRALLKSQLICIFYVPNTIYSGCIKGATSLVEIEKVILCNENLFKKYVKKAVSYFGKNFLDEQVSLNPKSCLPHSDLVSVSIEYILDQSITDFVQLDIRNGIPFPYYHSIYNANLPYILEKYI